MPDQPETELSPQMEEEIASILSDFDDPIMRAEWEAKLRRDFAAGVELADANLLVFNQAFEDAVKASMDDPAAYAYAALKLARKERIAAKQLAGVQKRFKTVGLGGNNYAAEVAEAASRSASPGKRRSQQRDRKYVEILGAAARKGELSHAGLVGTKIAKVLGTYRLPHWEKTTLPLKVLALSMETGMRGGRTINLRISHEAQAKALGSTRGPVSFVQNQVRETFKRRFEADAPEFWFVMEWDGPSKFHLHGAYELSSHMDHRVIDAALRAAGGWSGEHGAGLGQVSKPLTDAIQWASYTVKHLNLTSTVTDRKLFASTSEIRDRARGIWDDLRAQLPTT